jgi:hypothetical protein
MNESTSPEIAEFDLIPDPRVLPMLGEINLELWRCIAELIDNAIDGFTQAARNGTPIAGPRVDVTLPTSDNERATVRVLDNGPGMTPDTLQKAVRAGWSGNNPVDNLGLFGMGFNIATARMGLITEVWTTRDGDPEWHGVQIDFEKLRAQRSFKTPHLTRPKNDTSQHGTEIIIGRLKPEQRAWLCRSGNQNAIRKRLSQTYSAMLRPNGQPLTFQLFLNNRVVPQREHCVWSSERSASLANLGDVPAVISFQFALSPRVNCGHCMSWLPSNTDDSQPCPFCGSMNSLTRRERKIRGWIGLQRYLDKSEFGFDFIRNGRKIEIASKDLFVWRQEDVDEPEYPIDDPRDRGRFVGEIHVDHCRVDYAKQRFDRNDPAWAEMVQLIRGDGPLRPERARELGFGTNESPLYRLFKAFRRTSPQSSQAGAWKRILVVRDNDRASEMAKKFYDGDPDYQDDTKWWELIQEADTEALYGPNRRNTDATPDNENIPPQDAELPPGLFDVPSAVPVAVSVTEQEPRAARRPPPTRRSIPSMSRRYDLASASASWSVEAFETSAADDALPNNQPWAFFIHDVATRKYHFIYNRDHSVFDSITLTPQDALVWELSWQAKELLRGTREDRPQSVLATELREAYAKSEALDARKISEDAKEALAALADIIIQNCPSEERSELFDLLPVEAQQETMRSLAARNVRPNTAIADGSFLRFPPYHALAKLLDRRPDMFFDGGVWDEPYNALDYRDAALTDSARYDIREKYRSRLADAVWASTLDNALTQRASREELIRALMSIKLITPDVEPS